MKFTVNQKDLAPVLNNLARVTDKLIPFIRLEANSCDTITLLTTNGTNTMQAKVKAIDVAGEGVMVDAKKLSAIVNRLSDKIEFDDGLIKSGRTKLKVDITPLDNFKLNLIEGDIVKLKLADLKNKINNVSISCSSEETRQVLSGVCFNKNEIVATNGNVLSLAKIESPFENLVIPKNLVDEMVKCFEDVSEISIVANNKGFMAFSDTFVLVGCTLVGQYPPYQQLIPVYEKSVVIDKQEVLQALGLVSLVTDEKRRRCKLALGDNCLVVSSLNGDSDTTIDIEYSDEPMEIAFNIDYLSNALKFSNGDVVTLEFKGPLDAMLVRYDSEDLHLLMPIQLR